MREMTANDNYDLIEEDFNSFLDESISPRGPDLLYELVRNLPLGQPAHILDLGCGKGKHSIELAKRFGAFVCGVDPNSDNLEQARHALAEECLNDGSLRDLVRFSAGSTERIPLEDNSVDLVWCRDVLCLVEDLEKAYRECGRVLCEGGRVVVYQMFATDRLEPREAAEIYSPLDCVVASMAPEHSEMAIKSAGLNIEECIVLGTEWGEYSEEANGSVGRLLLHAARLIRDPDRYVGRFGSRNYEIKLADCLWHVYRLVGKLSSRIYILSMEAA